MFKFWKKKPAVDKPAVEKANEALLYKAPATAHSITEEVPAAALLARSGPVTLAGSLLAHPEIETFVTWVRKKPPGFYDGTRRSNRRR